MRNRPRRSASPVVAPSVPEGRVLLYEHMLIKHQRHEEKSDKEKLDEDSLESVETEIVDSDDGSGEETDDEGGAGQPAFELVHSFSSSVVAEELLL